MPTQANYLVDHDEIRSWVEERGGRPATIAGTPKKGEEAGLLRIDFPGGGLECVAIVYRTCRCADCGQARRDQEKVYAPRGNNSVAVIPRADAGNNSGPPTEGLED